MSFDNYNEGPMVVGSKLSECRPDYEAMAARSKAKLDACVGLEEAVFRFMAVNDTSRFSKIGSLAEVIGGLTIVRREQQLIYNEHLSKVEGGE